MWPPHSVLREVALCYGGEHVLPPSSGGGHGVQSGVVGAIFVASALSLDGGGCAVLRQQSRCSFWSGGERFLWSVV